TPFRSLLFVISPGICSFRLHNACETITISLSYRTLSQTEHRHVLSSATQLDYETSAFAAHQTRTACAFSRSSVGLPFPTAPERSAWRARLGFSCTSQSDLRAWMLLAWTRLSSRRSAT